MLTLPACNDIPLPDSDGDGIPDIIDPCPDNPDPMCVPEPDPPMPYDCESQPMLEGRYLPGDVAGQLIIVFKKRTVHGPVGTNQMRALVDQFSNELKDVRYFNRLNQVAVKLDDMKTLVKILADPNVLYVSQERTYKIKPEIAAATDLWGLDRIDQREGRDGEYEPGDTAVGIHVDIIDTGVGTAIDGVDPDPEFGGRLVAPCHTEHTFRGCSDGHGHGTHVAGIVGGKTYGVAKEVFLHAIRVLGEDGSGTTSQVIGGINKSAEWARASGQIRIANMSLGGPADPPLDAAVCGAMASGVVFAIAAGNDYGADPNGSSPARVIQAITVGAMNELDEAASFSNSGPAIDLWAPGEAIRSAKPGGGSETMSGTSMAAPHVAGAAALFLFRSPDATVAKVKAAVIDGATLDTLEGVGSSPNLLLYVRRK